MTAHTKNPGARAAAGAQDRLVHHKPDDTTPAEPRKRSRQEKWRANHPMAAWAHSALRSALRRGLITQQPCETCGAEVAEAHHPDHRDPLRVQWLCRRHHKALHTAQRRAGK